MPITTWQAIVGKFLASWLFLALALALTFPLVITVNYLGRPDNGVILCGYLGSWLMAGAYLAISCITSAMTRKQVVSFIVSVVLCLFLILAGFSPVIRFLSGWASPAVVSAVASCSFITHFENFEKGVLDSRDVIFFLSVIVFSLVHHRRDSARAPPGLRSAMKQKSFETLFYSAAGVAAMAVILVAINLSGPAFKLRADLTQDKAYTLSAGTKAILAKLDTPVTDPLLLFAGRDPDGGKRLSPDLRRAGPGFAG